MFENKHQNPHDRYIFNMCAADARRCASRSPPDVSRQMHFQHHVHVVQKLISGSRSSGFCILRAREYLRRRWEKVAARTSSLILGIGNFYDNIRPEALGCKTAPEPTRQMLFPIRGRCCFFGKAAVVAVLVLFCILAPLAGCCRKSCQSPGSSWTSPLQLAVTFFSSIL